MNKNLKNWSKLRKERFVHKSTTPPIESSQSQLPSAIYEGTDFFNKKLPVGHKRTCQCGPTHINCIGFDLPTS
jgi:hypothetical protein